MISDKNYRLNVYEPGIVKKWICAVLVVYWPTLPVFDIPQHHFFIKFLNKLNPLILVLKLCLRLYKQNNIKTGKILIKIKCDNKLPAQIIKYKITIISMDKKV